MKDTSGPLALIRLAPDAASPLSVADTAPLLRAALSRLAHWTTLEQLFADAVAEGGPDAAGSLSAVLHQCAATGSLEEGLGPPASPGLTCRIVPGSGLGSGQVAQGGAPYVFVAHCTILPQAGGWRIDSPVAIGEATVADCDLMAALARTIHGWTPQGGLELAAARLLLKAGLLVPQSAPQAEAPLSTPELWVHARSRRGSALKAVGATGRAKARHAAPALRPTAGRRAIALPVPDAPADPGFLAVLQARTSWRATPPGDTLSSVELGAILWHAARDLAPPRLDGDGFQRLSRPAPGAGGCHAADLFIALNPPAPGLPAFSRYDAAAHALCPIAADPVRLLREAAASMGQADGPAALVILSARFARLAWKYGDASYALMLKDAGVLLQTLHLTASALGRGSCILGGGNSRVFAALAGLDPLHDGPIGEIALTGRLPPLTGKENQSDAGRQ